MRHVAIELVTDECDRGDRASMRITVDGETLEAAGGSLGGGEPEDNTFRRDWNWVPYAMKSLAERLGCVVSVTTREATEEDEV